jgi:DNA-binding CsgD family transcriptional regulator
VESLAAAFSALLDLGVRDRTTFAEILRQTLEAQPGILAAWTVWEPNALDGRDAVFRHAPGHDATGRFMATWHRVHGTPRLEAVTGYEQPGSGDWYWFPKRHVLSCHIEPIYYPMGGRWVWITSQVAPIVKEGRFLGAVGIDCPAEKKFHRPCDATKAQPPVQASPLHTSRLDQLSPREREVYHWLTLGKSNEEIGIILGISHHTVKNHLERIFQKLGVNNRFEAMQISS